VPGSSPPARVALFPERRGDLRTACSCPDPANPCKHVAAVYYLLGEEFDRDPFLVVRLRGLERDDLLRRLGSRGGPGLRAPRAVTKTGAAPPTASREPLPADPRRFWRRDAPPDEPFGDVTGSLGSAAHLMRLGRFPFWRGAVTLGDALRPAYAAAAPRALDVFAGTPAASPGAEPSLPEG